MLLIVLILSLCLNGVLLYLLKREKDAHEKLKKEDTQNLEHAVDLANELHEEGIRKNAQCKRADKVEAEVKKLQKEVKTYKKSAKLLQG